ncbi:MAG: bifunctional ADP-heptose synthase, partial [FCB group bacterium]
PVIDIENETFHLGGAANVANNLKSLGIEPLLCGVIGYDNSGKSFMEIAKSGGINIEGLYTDKERPTTVKTRIIGNNQQIARLDRETRELLSEEGEIYILSSLFNYPNLSGIIFQDYNKGAISARLIANIIKNAMLQNIPVFVDPKLENFFQYKGVTVFKPNRKEARQALGVSTNSKYDLLAIGMTLLENLECENVLLTLGADGMMLFEANGDVSSVPTIARHVADVSGAGDTAIATLSAMVAGGGTIREASFLANYAAGVVCEEPGIVSITIDNLLKSVRNNSGE